MCCSCVVIRGRKLFSCGIAEVLWLRYRGPGDSDPGPYSCSRRPLLGEVGRNVCLARASLGGLEAFPSLCDPDAFFGCECPDIQCWSDGFLSARLCPCGGIGLLWLDKGMDARWRLSVLLQPAFHSVCCVNFKSAIKAIRIGPLWQVFLPKWR